MGKPVIVSDCQPLKRVAEETGCGLVFQAGEPINLAQKIVTLYNNEDLRNRLAANGKQSVEQEYNWQRESKKLLELYQKLSGLRSSWEPT